MDLKINIVEASAEMAEQRIKEYYARKHQLKWDIAIHEEQLNELIYVELDEDTIGYTDEAQDLFNAEYDEIFEKLVDSKVAPIPNLFNSMHLFIEDATIELANKKVQRYMKLRHKGKSTEFIADRTWELAELNSMVYTKEAQGVFDEAKVYYEMILKQFEV